MFYNCWYVFQETSRLLRAAAATLLARSAFPLDLTSLRSTSTRTCPPGRATNWIFFCLLFCRKKSLICLKGKSMTPHGTLFSSVPSSNSLVSVSDPRLASCVASGTTEVQGHCQVCRARRGCPRTPSTTTGANLDCAFVETALIYTDPRFWKVNRIELS